MALAHVCARSDVQGQGLIWPVCAARLQTPPTLHNGSAQAAASRAGGVTGTSGRAGSLRSIAEMTP